jgi:[ribosomal protein S5]-alanine N-acetyltransferase
MLLETERTYLREMTPGDAEQAYALNLDPEVLQYTGDDPFASVEAARSFLERYDQYARFGVGRWAVISKEDEQFLGWCGLKYAPNENEYDIGFRFFKQYWNKGYASETASACIAYGFEQLALPEIVGRARKENGASIRVLEKVGLTFQHAFEEEGAIWHLYRITKEAYLRL